MKLRVKTGIFKLILLGSLSTPAWAVQPLPIIDVYKSPACGCCTKWIDHLKVNGFAVRAHNTDDVVQHKYRLGVPLGHGSCHTAEVDGYVVEGHVSAREIKHLLSKKPKARGLVVPAMPMGFPGMEMGNRKDHYDVLLVNKNGSTRAYSSY